MKPRVLLVGEADGILEQVRLGLAAAGVEVEVAPDGFYAALWMERQRPAAVVVASVLPDMAARELAQILAEDPQLDGVKRLLLPLAPGEGADAETARHFDLVLPAGAPAERLAAQVAAALVAQPAAARRLAGAACLAGSLAAIDLARLLQVLGENRSTGALHLGFPQAEALVYFSRGEVVHCLWGELEGGEAVVEILGASLGCDAAFRFESLSLPEVFRQPRTVSGPVEKVLLDAAVTLDERGGQARRIGEGDSFRA